jgi:nucleoside-diphosphate-sugar epimerase
MNISGQQANSLLHDGHAWKDFPRLALSGTRRAIDAARAGEARILVHASFAFVHALESGASLKDPLRSQVDAILECEALALSGPVPACVVRLGYLYGPESADLLAYRKAFRLGRPYWAGPPGALQYHLHQFDAASSLLAAARQRNAGKVFYATDGHAVSFGELMDAFAHRVGRQSPLHLPLFLKPFARVIVREEHMQQAALPMPRKSPTPRVPGWKPRYPNYRGGLDQVVEHWGN